MSASRGKTTHIKINIINPWMMISLKIPGAARKRLYIRNSVLFYQMPPPGGYPETERKTPFVAAAIARMNYDGMHLDRNQVFGPISTRHLVQLGANKPIVVNSILCAQLLKVQPVDL